MNGSADSAVAERVQVPGGRTASSRMAGVGAVIAWGAGLIQFALGAGALSGRSSVFVAGIVLAGFGASAIVWGAATLARGRVVAPGAGIAGATSALLAGFAAFALDPAGISVLAVVAASVLWIGVGAIYAVAHRSSGRRTDAVSLPALLVAAVVVAALVTPELSAVEASLLAPRDGRPAIIVDEHRH